ncbi:hypothetical protein A3K73_06245 [Candidatus Pacearchaeota archaeon RBG_13_36_9]|nr:MAG: hypothetical protein A3K73_06245 [Candidatus Pacearchaeota archaeon RBG_13_36_9]
MQLEQTLQMYKPMQMSDARPRIYIVQDLESLSAAALYSGDSSSGFVPASSLNLGPGLARKMPEAGNMIERIRAPGAGDSEDADHINYEYLVPGVKKPLANIHIQLDTDKD